MKYHGVIRKGCSISEFGDLQSAVSRKKCVSPSLSKQAIASEPSVTEIGVDTPENGPSKICES